MASGSRNSSPPKSCRPLRRRAASRSECSSRATGRRPRCSSRCPDALNARRPARRRADVIGMIADRKASAEPGQMAIARLLAALARRCARRPLLTVLVSVAVAAAAALTTAHGLTFITSPLRLLPQGERYVVLLKQYL